MINELINQHLLGDNPTHTQIKSKHKTLRYDWHENSSDFTEMSCKL